MRCYYRAILNLLLSHVMIAAPYILPFKKEILKMNGLSFV